MKKRWILASVVVALALGGLLLLPVGGGAPREAAATAAPIPTIDLAAFSAAPPATSIRLVLVHHSCGGQLLADEGPDAERANCVYASAKNGGGLRTLLNRAGYVVHEASYGSKVGDKTDLFDWLPASIAAVGGVLAVAEDDVRLPANESNRIVLFKSCFTENRWTREGESPGDPAGPEKTLANAKAEFSALLREFEKRPDVLFVYLTSPPIAPAAPSEALIKWLAKKVLRRPTAREAVLPTSGPARAFANWAKSESGWLAGYPQKNVVVFDYYDVLTDYGASNLSRYPTAHDDDSHPSAAGNRKAAAALVPFLNQAVRRAGLAR